MNALVFLLATSFAVGADTKAPRVEIGAERVEFKPGEPLSVRALVPRPLPLTGVLSWSLESRRHRGAMWCLALSPDGRSLATGGLDGTVRVWNVESGKLVRALVGHNSYVSGLDWSPDGNTLASAGTFDATVRLWDTRSGQPLRVLRGHPNAASLVKWSPDGRTVLTAGGESGTVSWWNAVNGQKQGTKELGRTVLSMSWQPDGSTVALAVQALPLQIFEFEKSKVVRLVGNPNDGFNVVAWSPDGKFLAAGTAKNTILCDGPTGKIVQTLEAVSFALGWHTDSKQLASLSPGAIKVWDASGGQAVKTMAITGDHLFSTIGDLSTFATGNYAGFGMHDGGSGKSGQRFENLSGTMPPLWWYRKTLLTGIGTPKVTLFDVDTGKPLQVLEGHKAAVSAVAVSGKTIATASYDKTVRLWDAASGKTTQTFAEHTAAVLAVDFSTDGKLAASGGSDKQVLVWDAASAKLLHTLSDARSADVAMLAWKPGSSAVLASNGLDRALLLWNVRGDKVERAMAADHDLASVAWSPDGNRVAAGLVNPLVQIGQPSAIKFATTFEEGGSPPQVSSLAWSPNGQLLAAGRGNHTMQIWDPKSGKKLHSVATMAPVQRVSWSAGSSTIGASSQDRTLRFFDAVTGKLRGLVLAEENQLLAVGAEGHYRGPDAESELVYVVQTRTSQETYTPSQFVAKHKFKNVASKVVLFGK